MSNFSIKEKIKIRDSLVIIEFEFLKGSDLAICLGMLI